MSDIMMGLEKDVLKYLKFGSGNDEVEFDHLFR